MIFEIHWFFALLLWYIIGLILTFIIEWFSTFHGKKRPISMTVSEFVPLLAIAIVGPFLLIATVIYHILTGIEKLWQKYKYVKIFTIGEK